MCYTHLKLTLMLFYKLLLFNTVGVRELLQGRAVLLLQFQNLKDGRRRKKKIITGRGYFEQTRSLN